MHLCRARHSPSRNRSSTEACGAHVTTAALGDSAWHLLHCEPAVLRSPGSLGDAPDEAMLADFLSEDLASPEDAHTLFGGRLQARASAGSQASPWASDADAQAMLPLERMLDLLGQQRKPGAHHAALLPAQAQHTERKAAHAAPAHAGHSGPV